MYLLVTAFPLWARLVSLSRFVSKHQPFEDLNRLESRNHHLILSNRVPTLFPQLLSDPYLHQVPNQKASPLSCLEINRQKEVWTELTKPLWLELR